MDASEAAVPKALTTITATSAVTTSRVVWGGFIPDVGRRGSDHQAADARAPISRYVLVKWTGCTSARANETFMSTNWKITRAAPNNDSITMKRRPIAAQYRAG